MSSCVTDYCGAASHAAPTSICRRFLRRRLGLAIHPGKPGNIAVSEALQWARSQFVGEVESQPLSLEGVPAGEERIELGGVP